jgi:alcohol dehydrogenase (cytochrome c)
MSPSFNPETGLLYVDSHRSFSLYYAYATDKPEGFAGRDISIWSESSLKALDYKTGKAKWEHPLGRWEDWAGVLSTAGNVVFTGDTQGNILALDAENGGTLWHTYGGGAVQTAPITYQLDGRQYVLIGSSSVLYAFSLPQALLDKSRAAE